MDLIDFLKKTRPIYKYSKLYNNVNREWRQNLAIKMLQYLIVAELVFKEQIVLGEQEWYTVQLKKWN